MKSPGTDGAHVEMFYCCNSFYIVPRMMDGCVAYTPTSLIIYTPLFEDTIWNPNRCMMVSLLVYSRSSWFLVFYLCFTVTPFNGLAITFFWFITCILIRLLGSWEWAFGWDFGITAGETIIKYLFCLKNLLQCACACKR